MAWTAASYSHRQWLTTGDWENAWAGAERKTGATFGVSLLTCLLLLGWCNNKNIHINSFGSYLGIQGRKVKVNICSGPQLYPITDAEYIYRVILSRLQVIPFYTTKLKRRIICKGVSQGHSIFHEAVMKNAPQPGRKKTTPEAWNYIAVPTAFPASFPRHTPVRLAVLPPSTIK